MTPALELTVGLEMPGVEGLGRAGDSVLLSVTQEGKDGVSRREVVEVAPGATTWGPPLFEEPDEIVFDPVTQRPLGGGGWDGNEWTYTFLDPKDQSRWKS